MIISNIYDYLVIITQAVYRRGTPNHFFYRLVMLF